MTDPARALSEGLTASERAGTRATLRATGVALVTILATFGLIVMLFGVTDRAHQWIVVMVLIALATPAVAYVGHRASHLTRTR